jgi:hypothetical protein
MPKLQAFTLLWGDMKATTFLILRKLFVLAILFLLSIAVLTAQVKIKEKVEIKPKAINTIQANSSSLGFGCFNEYPTGTLVIRPCWIVGSGQVEYPEHGPDRIAIFLEDLYYGSRNIAHTTDSVEATCGAAWVCVWSWVYMVVNERTKSISGNDATFTWSGMYEAGGPHLSPFTATAVLHATPRLGDPHVVMNDAVMNENPASIDLNETNSLSIYTKLLDDNGNPFVYCDGDIPIFFELEDRIEGATLRDHDNPSHEGDTITVPLVVETVCIDFICYPPHGVELDTIVKIRADVHGLSGSQSIHVIKFLPDHFHVLPEADTIFAGEAVVVRAIAKKNNDDDESLDKNALVTFIDESEYGSFIVDSDTTLKYVTVPYEKAWSGGVKYYAPAIASDNADSKEVEIKVFRAKDINRKGEGYLNVISYCPVILLSKTEAKPGDTVGINIMGRTRSGALVSFPENQKFGIWMNTDESYGKLRSLATGEEGPDLYTQQPFELIVSDSIGTNAAVVELEVTVPYGYSGGSGGGADRVIGNDSLRVPANMITAVQKRLSAAKTKNANLAAKLHAAGTTIAKDTISELKSLASSIKMSTNSTQASAVCDPPIASVKINEDCIIGVPSDKMNTFDKSNIEPRRFDDGPNCDYLVTPKDAGYTFVDGIRRSNGGQSSAVFNYYEGAIYAVPFKAYIDWGLCLSHNPYGLIQIKIDLSNVNSSNANKIVDELSQMCTAAEEVPGYIPYLNYSPVNASEDHEYAHVKDYIEKLVPYYNDALSKINSIEPIRNWCHLTEEQLQGEIIHKYSEAQSIIETMRKNFDEEVEGDEVFTNTTFDNAKIAEIEGIKNVIDKIKTKFNIK